TRPTPNPVTSSATSIRYIVPSRLDSAPVSITIFDVSGRAVRSFAPGTPGAGQHSIDWDLRDADGSEVTNGIYFYRLTVGTESINEKLLVVRQ
ncbi:MAG TPA: FlgD immunoglobulin-like domain containing protein, partial [Candidatus Eisenbacteria bacterium]